MNELSEDKTRNEILSKIASKRNAVEKIASKPQSILSQKEIYERALEDHKRKIRVLEEKIEQFSTSAVETENTHQCRVSELEHMEDILSRYDAAFEERASIGKKILEIVNADTWKPGDDIASAGAYRKSPEYLELTSRRDLLDNVIENALPDVRKILVSRGEVSDYHKKELGSEIPE